MRHTPWLLLTLLLSLLLAACQAPRGAAPPALPVAGAPAGAAAASGAPGTAPAPPPLPDSAALRVAPPLGIEVVRTARVYTGRGPFYLVVEDLRAGTAVEYLGSREGWLLVRTPQGGTGWLASADAALSDASGRPIEYQVKPSLWEVHVDGGPAVKLSRVGPGVMQVKVRGLSGEHRLTPLAGGSLALLTHFPGSPSTGLAVGDGGISGFSLTDRGVLFDLEHNPVYRVLRDDPDQIDLEFRPGLERVERLDNGWRLRLRGDAQPVLRRGDGGLMLDLPSTLPTPELAALPAGVSLEVVAPEPGATPPQQSTTAAVPGRMPTGGLRLHLPAPAGPYALYRPTEGSIELRLLPPGLAGKTIVLDPGHGGEESGATGDAGNAEKDVNLAVALRLQALLEQAGARVVMTRTTDARVLPPEKAAALATESERTRQDLEERVDIANGNGADLLLSIHANGGTSADRGTETFWAIPNLNATLSQRFAGLVQDEMLQALGLVDRGVKQRPFHMVRFPYAPSALVELAFMTDPSEEALLTSDQGQAAAAHALLRAMQRYFSEPV